jgi:hypothetical protein
MRSKTLNLTDHYCLKSTLTSLAVGLDNHQGQLSANPIFQLGIHKHPQKATGLPLLGLERIPADHSGCTVP